MLSYIEDAIGLKAEVKFKEGRKVDVNSIILDSTAAENCLAWTPQVELNDGLLRTWRWITYRMQ